MKIYVHGNCQAPAIARLIADVAGQEHEITAREVFSLDLERDRDAYMRDVAEADVIFAQPVSSGYRGVEWLGTDWVTSTVKPGAKTLIFPVIYHRGLLPQCFPLPHWHQGRLAYHDAHALDYFLRGRSVEEFLACSSKPDFLPRSFVLSEALSSTLELLRREYAAGVDASVSDIIAERQEWSQPLFVVNHPERAVLAALTNRLLHLCDAPFRVSQEGPELLNQFILPPYVSVLKGVVHSGQDIRVDRARFDHKDEPREIFFAEVFKVYEAIGRAALTRVVAESDLGAYLARYRRALGDEDRYRQPRVGDILRGFFRRREASAVGAPEEADLVCALYRLFLGREPSQVEVLQHLKGLDHSGYEALLMTFARAPEFLTAGGGEALMHRAATWRQSSDNA